MSHQTNSTRRQFIGFGLIAAAAVPLFRLMGSSTNGLAYAKDQPAAKSKTVPLPAGMSAATENDPIASAVGYKQNVKDIDFKKYPKRKEAAAKTQVCSNCQYYTSSNEGWGKCQIIASGLVAAGGWCGTWSKKV